MTWRGQIDAARRIGLDVLQPTRAQLQHGLELHAASLVCESYGLGLRAPVDGAALAEAVAAGASEVELAFLGASMAMTGWARDDGLREEYAGAWSAAGVTCTFQNAGEEGNDPLRLLERLAHYTHLTDRLPDQIRRAARPDDIEVAHRRGSPCLYLTGNGVPLAGEQANVAQELRYVRLAHELGCRMMHLTYNRRNPIGEGCAEAGDAGLSDFGRAAIAELNRVGVIVDVAHCGWRTCVEAAQVSMRPIVSSHAACDALNHHHRCKPDEVMKAIADTGGTVGITNVPAFLGGSGDLQAFLDHIEHAVRVVGVDHVTIGTDRPYVSVRCAEESAKVPSRGPQRDRWEALWWPDDPVRDPRWKEARMVQSLAWTNWPLFTVGLVQRGYGDDEVRQIIGGNILRVARQVWAG